MQFTVHTVRWQPPLDRFNSENSKLYEQPLHPCSSKADPAVNVGYGGYP
ncbi:rCG31638 [Rattus norvegicus]|uniref:RCG31638 n=1 Tax=Rattus norvegicus TaxID=10116 RepID=A6JN88_RAT|nr:rCG31638 [Rattus norvegicus]